MTRHLVGSAALLAALQAACVPAGPEGAPAVERSCAPAAAGTAPIPFGGEGLLPLCDGVFAEAATTAAEREVLRRDAAEARARVEAAFGRLRGPAPVILFCKTHPCRVYFTGPARRSWTLGPGRSVPGARYVAGDRDTVIVDEVSPKSRGILAHELVHAEAGARVGQAFVPQWFHEGIAAALADAPVCEPALARGVDDLRLLDAPGAWNEHTSRRERIHETYCQARAEVEAWGRAGGAPQLPARLVLLLDAVRSGAPFDAVYGPLLTQPARPAPFEEAGARLRRATVLLAGTLDSHVAQGPLAHLADRTRPLTLALWVRPARAAGVLAHLSAAPDGSGWCFPPLGFDAAGRLVGQVLHGHSPDLSSFFVAVHPAPLPPGRWTHVALTWAPQGALRLWVGGRLSVEVPAPAINAAGAGAMTLTWGSSNLAGDGCWHGAIAPGAFRGALAGMTVRSEALAADQVAALAREAPPAP